MITEKILVVDDEITVCESIKKILTRQGYSVDNTLNAEDAMKKINESAYDLVITDLMMPNTNGLELLQLIKDYYPELEVVVVTGFATIDSAVKATKLGASDYIPKPFTPDELMKVTKKALEKRKANARTGKKEDVNEEPKNEIIDVDMPFSVSEVEHATSKEYVETLTHSDIPHARKIEKKTEYCTKGERECRRLVLEKRECEGECPLVKKERERAAKSGKLPAFLSKGIVDVDIPFNKSEVEQYTSTDYMNCLDRSDIPRAALYGRNIISKHTVLVVDDEPVVCNSLRKIMRKQNCNVDEAFDVDVALNKMKLNKYDLIFLDLKMPKISGMEVLKSIKKNYPKIPVVMITGYASIETAIEATRLGAFNFIPKPFTPDELNKVTIEALAA
jgi:DNA-binding response OmpR family regulator